MEIKERKLTPEYDKAASFYGKAFLKIYYTESKIISDLVFEKIELFSYDTHVMTLKNNTYIFNYNVDEKLLFSKTTQRHIKETLKQFYWYLRNDELAKNNYTLKDIKKYEGVRI